MRARRLPLLLGSMLLTSCGTLPALRPTTPASDVTATAQHADYVRDTQQALATALRQGDAASVQAFCSYAAGSDPDPAASREIARRTLDELGSNGPAALRARVAAIAAGQVTPAPEPRASAVRFPHDEAAHRSSLTEWWYVNGHLQDKAGASFGFEFTLFKAGPLLHWAHVAVTDVKGARFHYVRQAIKPSEALDSPDRLMQRYGEQLLAGRSDGSYLLAGRAQGAKLSLSMRPEKAPMLINGDGRIDMPEGAYSWYYSQTRVAAQGSVDLGAGAVPVTGTTWIDHQWGPFYVSGLRDRWDWFSLQFADQTEYNLFAFRDRAGNPVARYVNRMDASGQSHHGEDFRMERLAWWQSPLTRLFYVRSWRLALPGTGEAVELQATNDNQELARAGGFDPLPEYWEGKLVATKTLPDGTKIPGLAYCEHFGFPTPGGPTRH